MEKIACKGVFVEIIDFQIFILESTLHNVSIKY